MTATRWTEILESLGHRVTVGQYLDRSDYDLLVALHARRSFAAIKSFREQHSNKPIIVALTGTDLYRDISTSRRAKQALEIADCLVLLQPMGCQELSSRQRAKARVIFQSAQAVSSSRQRDSPYFQVCVLGHLRSEKDPFRTALALRTLPASSKIRVLHLGQSLSLEMEKRAIRLMKREKRYRWLGEVSRQKARRILAQSQLLVLSSRMEGGANVISEALAEKVPVLASRIPGSVGILGKGYPGYFPVANTKKLARLLQRAESDKGFYGRLKQWCLQLAPLIEPRREREAWATLLKELPVN